eukprot:1158924-Pelagomonas_calceolata.AAC.6
MVPIPALVGLSLQNTSSPLGSPLSAYVNLIFSVPKRAPPRAVCLGGLDVWDPNLCAVSSQRWAQNETCKKHRGLKIADYWAGGGRGSDKDSLGHSCLHSWDTHGTPMTAFHFSTPFQC